MAAGLGLLRLPPQQFWSMTPRELSAALRVMLPDRTHAAAPTRAQLDALLQRFPD